MALIIVHNVILTIARLIFNDEGSTFEINESFGSLEKNLSINFTKANTTFSLSLHYNANSSYLFVNGKQIFKFKADNKNVNLPICFFSR